MTVDEARAVGFEKAAAPPGAEVRLVAVSPRDARFVQSRLEASAAVQSICAHEVV